MSQIEKGPSGETDNPFYQASRDVGLYTDLARKQDESLGRIIKITCRETLELLPGSIKNRLPEWIVVQRLPQNQEDIYTRTIEYKPKENALYEVRKQASEYGPNDLGYDLSPVESELTRKATEITDDREWLKYGQIVVNILKRTVETLHQKPK